MASDNALIGVYEIKMGACGANGTVGSSLTKIGDYVPDSCGLYFDEMTKTDLEIEDSDTVWHTIVNKTVPRRVEFTVRDVSPANLASAFGGTVLNSTRWEAPVQGLEINQSVTIETLGVAGYKRMIYIPKGVVRASLDGKLQKKDSGNIKFTVDIVTPYNGTTALPAIYIDKVPV